MMDYKKLKLKVGIEIHQQLDTHKLFCNCPSILRDDEPDFEVHRRMHASSGEAGKIDVAAKAEMAKDRNFIYQGYNDTTCAVEMDEEPPHDMNKDALKTVLTFAKLVKADIVPRIEVMRKIIANGSVTTGFQRTSLIATDGVIKNKTGDVAVATVLLEEDACKDIEKRGDDVVYRVDRQGIPLIEISTDASIKTPIHAQEIAKTIGMYLRSTGKVKRGLGTIRQDLNVSIMNGNRIEIKGAQDLKNIPNIIDNEIIRQISLNEIKDELNKRKAHLEDTTFTDFKKHLIKDVTDIFQSSESKVIKGALDKKGKILALKLEHFRGLLGKEVQPGRRLGSELSDYAKQEAGVGGIFHLDELPKYGIEQSDVDQIVKQLNCTDVDGFVLCADLKSKAERALYGAYKRAILAITTGVIPEVRNVVKEVASAYMRPIPGAARMYPETDVESIIPDLEGIELPELIDAKIKRYEKTGMSSDLARDIAKDYSNTLFENLMKAYPNLKPASIAEKFLSIPKELRRKSKLEFDWNLEIALFLFSLWDQKKIDQASMINIIEDAFKFKDVTLSGIKNIAPKYELLSEKEAIAQITQIIKTEKAAKPDINRGALMGAIMRVLKGRVDPAIVNKQLSEEFK